MANEQQAPQQPRPFRIIIAGGGLVAITAAHIFSQADIDFVILEKHDNVTLRFGSVLGLWPATHRILHQLGIRDAILPMISALEDSHTISANDGSFVRVTQGLDTLWARNHGYGGGVMSRPRFVNIIYACLSESAKARIYVGKRVTDIEVLSDGVRVHCADGTVEQGTIVIGADGVHSRTRQCMEALIGGKSAGKVDRDMGSPYLATYRMLLGTLPEVPRLKPGGVYQSTSYGQSSQIIMGKGRGWWSVYEALEEPTRRRHRYTEQDKQDMISKYGDRHMAPGYRLRDIYSLTVGETYLINLEEGRVDRWTWGGRIALVGDAIRKLHPQAGFGYNSGVGDITELANGLYRLLHPAQGSKEGEPLTEVPSADMLQDVFDEYEKKRKESETTVHIVSRTFARDLAWQNWGHRLMATWVMPILPLVRWVIDYMMAPVIACAPVLDWLQETELPQGASPWLRHPQLRATSG